MSNTLLALQGLNGNRGKMMKTKVEKIIALMISVSLAFYAGWQGRGVYILGNHQGSCSFDNGSMNDEDSTFNTIDSILLQAILYSKANGNYPELNLIEIPIGASIKRGKIMDQYGHKIYYGVTNNILEVRSSGKDGRFGTNDDIIGIVPLNKTGRYITGKNATFFHEIDQ